MGNKERVAYALLFGFILRYYFFFLSRLDEYIIFLFPINRCRKISIHRDQNKKFNKFVHKTFVYEQSRSTEEKVKKRKKEETRGDIQDSQSYTVITLP